MRLRRLCLALSLAALAAACSSSHTPGGRDAGRDAATSACGPCAQPCCDRDPSTGLPVTPFCPGALGCEGPPPMGCAALSETGCWADPSCAPIYDDECCPTCRPIGACADCVDPVFFACVPVEEACGPGAAPCGATPSCGDPLDCESAAPDLGRGSCSVPGCVPALEAGCREGCFLSCRPVTGGSCTASCEIVEPRCPDGMVAEADGGCYTGFCIPGEVCGR